MAKKLKKISVEELFPEVTEEQKIRIYELVNNYTRGYLTPSQRKDFSRAIIEVLETWA